MKISIIRHSPMNASSKFFLITLLIGSLLSISDVYAVAEKEGPRQEEVSSEEIISVLQKGIGLLKYEIQRDQDIVSRKMLIPILRQLRITLKKDIGPKEQLISDLNSYLADKLQAEILSLQSTLSQEKKIVESNHIGQRAQRVTRNVIKESIPVKENILASFEKVLPGYQ